MKFLLFLFVFSAHVMAVESIRLEADAIMKLEFPALPETLHGVIKKEKAPAMLTARLPVNYTSSGSFPLFVFLTGSEGGKGDQTAVARSVIGENDFICVNLPLFKRRVDPAEMLGGMLIGVEDMQVLVSSYQVMLKRLIEVVPNITPERSAIGGFSNGAHTTGVLLASQDEFLMEHFTQFYLIEGGVGPLMGNVLQKKLLTRKKFLLMRGDKNEGFAHELMEKLAQILEAGAKLQKFNFTSIIMRGHGHEMPPDYLSQVGAWARKS